jgi:RHS repeat-associated protein
MKSLPILLLLSIAFTKIYSQNNDYLNPWNNSNFNNKSITLPTVGSTPGSANVSSGTASYSIPIHIPPGTNGVIPSLSISYNSMGGNGILGMGWSLGGLSMISRAPHNRYLDGEVSEVQINNNDRFALDGGLLINTAGTNGNDLSEYKTESESFSKIIAHTISGIDGPGWFEVITKDGIKMEFGKTADSRRTTVFNGNGNPRILFWKLNRIIHPDNNFIDYVYESLNGDLRIKQIKYTGHINPDPNPETAPFHTIVFNYLVNRKDPILVYEASEKILNKNLIANITTPAKTYSFKYAQDVYVSNNPAPIDDNLNTVLKEIIEETTFGVALNSTVFKYGDRPVEFTNGVSPKYQSSGTFISFAQGTDLFAADFNGDGYSDILAATQDYQEDDPFKYYTNFRVYKKIPETDSYSETGPISFGANYAIINKKKTNDRHNYIARDLTGEGRDDIITAQTSASGSIRDLLNLKIFISNEASGVLSFQDLLLKTPSDYFRITNTSNFLHSGDFDGDGLQDLLMILGNTSGQHKIFIRYGSLSLNTVCTIPDINNPAVNVEATCFKPVLNLPSYLTGTQIAEGIINVIDFDGDGKNDLMVTNGTKTEVISFKIIYPVTTDPSYTNAYSLFENTTPLNANNLIYFGDFNGDRKTDIFYRASITTQSANWTLGFSNGKGFETQAFTFPSDRIPNTSNYSGDQISIADFNGDGKTDIYHGHTYIGVWTDGGTLPPTSVSFTNSYMYYSRGDGTFYAPPLQNTDNISLGSTENNYVYDTNGDGRSEILALPSFNQPMKIFYFRKDGKENLLEKVKTGNGHITEFNYKRLNEGGPFYNQGNLDEYDINQNPINNIRLPIYCVSELKADNGIAGFNSVKYQYDQAKLHKAGKGLMGFQKIISISDATLNNTFRLKSIEENEFSIKTPNISFAVYVAIPKKSQSYLIRNFGANNQSEELLSETTMDNTIENLGLRRYFIKTNSVENNNVFEKKIITTTNTYDLNTTPREGNITSSTSTIKANDIILETVTTTTEFGSFPNNGIKNKPTKVTIEKTRNGQSPFTVINEFDYLGNGQLNFKIDFSGLQKAIKTQFTYDENEIPNSSNKYSLGNVVKTVVSSVPLQGQPQDFNTRETSATFDSYGRYPLTITNELGQTTSYEYDENFGKPTKIKGVDDQTTIFKYDDFGKLLKKANVLFTPNTPMGVPSGYLEKIDYSWEGTIGNYKTIIDTYEVNNVNDINNPSDPKGNAKTTTYFDILGREYQKVTEGFKSVDDIFTGQTYDNRGNVATSSRPKKGSLSTSIITNEFDEYNRPTKVISSDGLFGTSQIEYSAYTADGKLTITTKAPDYTVANNKKSSKTVDATGKTYSATDNGGTLYYTYNSQGNLTHVNSGTEDITVSPIFNTISQFDDYGRQISLVDLNAGTTTYIYNGLGQLVSETHPYSTPTTNTPTTTTMIYDLGGRITSRNGGEGVTSYEYYDTGTVPSGSKGKLKKVTSFVSGNTEEYTYDNKGRLYNKIDKIDGKELNTFYLYNNFDDIISKRYPTNLLIKYEYDANGYLEFIRNDADATKFLYKATEMNAYGQFNKYELGNGKSSEASYYEGIPINFSTSGIQNLSMLWDYKNGNLTRRTDARDILNTRVENFIYDNLNRLTKTTVTGLTEYNTNYEANGNILNKTGVGSTYSYNVNKVVDIANNNNQIAPQKKQEITYTTFQQPLLVKEEITGQAAQWELVYTYGSDYNRIKSVLSVAGEEKIRRYYFGDYEESKNFTNNVQHNLAYISSPVGLIAIIDGNSTSNYHYTYTDHLGSIVTTTDGTGGSIVNQNFDAWGKRRNASTWEVLTYDQAIAEANANTWWYRGYTGHEMLDQFGLINMNGRMYDPLIGRVLSPDNLVNDPFDTQSFNRYSYVLNNPLKYNDPDGQTPAHLFAAIIGGAINVAGNWSKIRGGRDFFAYFGIGAAGGLVATTGNIVGSGALTSSLNAAYDIATGKMPNINSATDVLKYVGTQAVIGAVSAYGADKAFKLAGPAISDIATKINGWFSRVFTGFANSNGGSIVLPNGSIYSWFVEGGIVGKMVPVDRVLSSTIAGNVGKTAAKGGVQIDKASGSYLLEFQSGKFYVGKGLEPRMMQSIKRIEATGDKLLGQPQFFPASSTKEAFINEFKLMKDIDLPTKYNPNSKLYNQIWSPGKKFIGQ